LSAEITLLQKSTPRNSYYIPYTQTLVETSFQETEFIFVLHLREEANLLGASAFSSEKRGDWIFLCGA